MCLGVLILSVSAQAERLPIRSYTVADGLPHNHVNRIVRDSRGFLWFCTAEGLSVFDGYRFTSYGTADGLPHQNVTDFLETRDGEYWVASSGGLARFNPRGAVSDPDANRMFSVLTPPGDDRRERVLTRIVQGQDGTIWAGSWDGLLRVARADGADQLVRVDLNASDEPAMGIETLLEDRFGTLWVGASNGLYRRWPDSRVARYDKRTGLPGEFVHDLLEDRQGQLWVGTREGGFFNLVTDADETPPVVGRSYRATNGFTDWVFDLHETSRGRFFVATNHGLFELSSAPGMAADRPQLHTTRSGFVYHEIENVAEDGAGNVWLGTVNGAMKIARGGFRTFDRQDGVYLVNALFESTAGELHAFGYVSIDRTRQADQQASSGGVENYAPRIGQFDGQRFSWLLPKLNGRIPSWSPRPFILQAQGGEWWIGTNNGLVMFPRAMRVAQLANTQPAAVYSTRHGLATAVVYSIYEDSRSDLWVSTIASPNGVNGLARWDRSSGSTRDLAQTPGLPSLREHLPVSFREDRAGHIWVGFSPGGLARYTTDSFEVFTEADGLPPGTVNELLVDRAGRLWVATARGGIARVDDPTALRPTFTTYSTAQGLSSDRVTTITEDEQGLIWVGTGRGLDQITPPTGRIKHFTTADGLASGEVMSALRDRSGALWFGTRQGVSRVVPEPEWPSQPPPIWISGLRVAGERWNLSALGEAVVNLPDLRADGNQLQIDFLSVSFAPGETLRYQYKLEGAHTDWNVATEQRTVHLAGLAPGDYTFLVRAINSDQAVSPTPARVRFSVLAPVWRRTWFIALGAAGIALLLYALYRHRLSRLLELERVRTRIASDLHDDIGAALSRIAVLSGVAEQEAGDGGAPARSRLSVIANASRDVLDAMSDIVWATNPQRDQVRDLAQRMRRFASDMFSARPIAFSFRAPYDERRLSIGADVRRHVFLIFKEAVNNIVRHSSCSKADIELRVEGRRLALTVSDNGQGFDASLVEEGNGLRNMHARARMIGGDFRVDSHEGGGTIVGLTVDRHATVSEREARLQRPKS